MALQHYSYAISVVAMKDQAVNNLLLNGVADRHGVIAAANAIERQFDAAYRNSIVMISCNLGEERAGGMLYQFALKYSQASLEGCVNDLVLKLEGLLG